jgi:hypothetical protein
MRCAYTSRDREGGREREREDARASAFFLPSGNVFRLDREREREWDCVLWLLGV